MIQLCTQRELRAAVVGAGVFGRFHAAKYASIEGVKLCAIADPDTESRRQAATHLGFAAIADWRVLLGEVDVVSICSPASTHAEIVHEFLSAGAHVLVEKPIATELDEAEELILLAQERGLILTVGHQERFVFAKSGLLDRHSAPPLRVECVRAGPWTGRGGDVSVVLDLMIHDIDLVHRLLPGGIGDVRARGRSVHGALSDEVHARIAMENGAVAELFASRAADIRKRSMRIIYPDGTVEIDFLARTMTNTTGRILKPLDMADPLGESVASFVSAVQGGTAALVRPEEARQALETAILVEETAEPVREYYASRRPGLRAIA